MSRDLRLRVRCVRCRKRIIADPEHGDPDEPTCDACSGLVRGQLSPEMIEQIRRGR